MPYKMFTILGYSYQLFFILNFLFLNPDIFSITLSKNFCFEEPVIKNLKKIVKDTHCKKVNIGEGSLQPDTVYI